MQASTALPPSASTWAPASAVSGCPAATAPRITTRLLRAGRYPRLCCRDANLRRPAGGDSRRRRRGVARGGARLARPARLRPGRARVPADALPERRLRALEQLLVRRAATASSPTAPSTTRWRRCSGSACSPSRPSRPRRWPSRSSSRGEWGPTRAGRAGRSPSSGAGSSSRPRSRSRSAPRSRCSRSGRCRRAALALRRARGADARGQPARLPAADAAAGRVRDRALGGAARPARARADDRRLRRRRVRALARVPRLGPATRSRGRSCWPRCVFCIARDRALVARRAAPGRCWWMFVVYLVAVPRCVRDPERGRRERAAHPLRRDPARGADALAAPLAAAAVSRLGVLALAVTWNVTPPAVRLPPRPQRPGDAPGLLDARRSASCADTSRPRTASRWWTRQATGPRPTWPRRTSRSRAAAIARTTSRRTSCSTTTLGSAGLRRLAAEARRPLRRADERAGRLQRPRRGDAAALRALGPVGRCSRRRD